MRSERLSLVFLIGLPGICSAPLPDAIRHLLDGKTVVYKIFSMRISGHILPSRKVKSFIRPISW